MAIKKSVDKGKAVPVKKGDLDFDGLVSALVRINTHIAAQTSKAINMGLTARNWLYGFYILAYEQEGADRAAYGERLLDKLSKRLKQVGQILEPRTLRQFRQFAKEYPQIGAALAEMPLGADTAIWQSLSAKSATKFPALSSTVIRDSLGPEFADSETQPIRQTVSAKSSPPGSMLLEKLSFSALTELLQIDDPLKRAFYEMEAIRGGWSVRELRRQIATLLYERTGLSADKKAVVERGRKQAGKQMEKAVAALTIRDPYVFEFLGLQPHEALDEANLESLLLHKMQDFLLELGHGFCFEGRRKRILMGDEYGFVDLVFYHRILKCHVLVELKVDEFSHQHLGQLNTYVQWYKENMMADGDNPPIGILLCTKKGKARRGVVEYALAGMDNRLFVSRYAVELPKKAEMEKLLSEWAGE